MTGSGDAFAGTPETWRFDTFVIDPATFRLEKDGAQIRIEPKAFEVLLYLIRNRSRVVAKQELLDSVWAGTVVTENALTRAVAQIRKVLGDELKAPRYIETIPTRGYRFIAELEQRSQTPEPSVAPSPAAPIPPAHPLSIDWRRVRRAAFLVFAVLLALQLIPMFIVRYIHSLRPKLNQPPTDPPLAASRVTPPDGLYLYPSFSPDGQWIAYTSTRNGALTIFKSRSDGTLPAPITSGDPAIQPAWSPDGQTIAFSRPGGGIWIQPVRGGDTRRLSTFGSRPAWSPDGRHILFQSGEQVELASTIHEPWPPSQIFMLEVAGGTSRALTRTGKPAGSHGTPNWRGDGKRIVFTSCLPDDCAIYTMARDGSDLRAVTRTNFRISSALYSPRGSDIFYLHSKYGTSDLMRLPAPEGTEQPRLARRTPWSMMQHLALSADGSRLAWSTIEQTSNLVSLDLNTSALTPLTRHTGVRATFPSFSPDGKKLAYVALIGENDSGVWIADPDGTNAKPLTAGRNLNQRLQWSSNGFEVTYAAWAEGPVIRSTSLVNEKSFVIRRLPRHAKQPTLSPDRSMVAFDRILDGESSVWIGEEGRARRITPVGQDASLPVWSPSGRLIAMQVRDANGRSQIAVVSPLGGDPRVLTRSMEESWPHTWSPDEKFIAFAGRRSGVWNVWKVSPDGGEPTAMTSYTDPAISVRSPAWSADGKRIVFEYAEPQSAIWISHRIR